MALRCDRAREWISLRLDGELSELEARMLDRHLGACAGCAAWTADLDRASGVLRAAPLELPSRRFELPAPAATAFPIRRRLAFVGVAAALVLGSIIGAALDRPGPRAESPAPQLSFLTRDLTQLRTLPRGRHVTPAPNQRQPGIPPEGAV